MTKLEWALQCAEYGWLVFPSKAKRPLVKWSVNSTKDAAVITGWWNQWPDADVCIKTGAESDLVVVDWDAYKGSNACPLDVPTTYTTQTPSGGLHWYFAHPGFPVSNSAGVLAEYVDVRGDGGMVVAYQPILSAPIAALPEGWGTPRIKTVDLGISLEPAHPFKPGQRWAEHLLEAALADIRFAQEGKRNFTLYAAASDVYRLVWAGALDKAAATQALGDEAQAQGLDPQEIAATLLSAMRNGATQFEKGAN